MWVTHKTTNPGIPRSISLFSGLLDKSLNQGPVSVQPHWWWNVKPELIHSLTEEHFEGTSRNTCNQMNEAFSRQYILSFLLSIEGMAKKPGGHSNAYVLQKHI